MYVGDIIVCEDNRDTDVRLTKGGIYQIRETALDASHELRLELFAVSGYWRANRFRHCTESERRAFLVELNKQIAAFEEREKA